MSSPVSGVGDLDRLSFTVFLALAIHAVLIFGISFSSKQTFSRSQTLDVTLSTHKSDAKVELEDADFLSDADQLGSGTLEEKAQLTTTEQADIEDNKIFHTTPTLQQISFSELSSRQDRIIATNSNAKHSAAAQNKDDGKLEDAGDAKEIIDISKINDVSTLKAKLDESRQAYAKRPRTKTLTSLSTKRAPDARYIFNWAEKIGRIGNQNYPSAAREQRLSGHTILAVTVKADGSVKSVEITTSSGKSVLDQFAKQSVFLAAPFETLPAEVLEDHDELVIIRTWFFRTDNRLEITDG